MNLPRMTSLSRTGIVMRSSKVPEPLSAAMGRIVTAGTTKTHISHGRYENN